VKSEPGTYALILQSYSTGKVQIGRLGQIEPVPGYYIYVGSAFGPDGVMARVSRHWRMDKPKHWHIDYLREFVTPLFAWVSYEPVRLEHQ
jgi:Uri superfamily endonuclease